MRYLLTPVVVVRAVSALATVADTKHAATQVSAVEAEQFLRHQEVASSPPASPHYVFVFQVDWMAKAMVSRTLQESLMDILSEDNIYQGRA